MTARPTFYPELGKYFRGLRTARKLGFRQAVQTAQGLGLSAITKQALFGLEKGQTKNADPDVLRDVGRFYNVPYEDLVALIVRQRYAVPLHGRDLSRHPKRVQTGLPSTGGAVDVAAAARIRELESRVEDLEIYETIVTRVRPLLRDALVIVGQEGDKAAEEKTARRRRH